MADELEPADAEGSVATAVLDTPDPAAAAVDPWDLPGEAAGAEPEFTPSSGGMRVYLRGVESFQLGVLGALDVVDDPAEAQLVVISTRVPRSTLSAMLATVRERATCPIVALTHTGGEPLAVEIMRAGGTGIVAEGNEPALAAFVNHSGADSGLVTTYDRRMGGRRDGDRPDQGLDSDTSLPSATAFDERLEDLGQAGEVPRIAFMRVRNLEPAFRRLASEATAVLRRRLAVQFREVARTEGAELYVLDDSEFALLGAGLSPFRAEELGRQLARITESFAPNGNTTLKLAVGHAGPEVTDEIPTLRELAQRAVGVAAEQATSAVVGADSLSLGLASTTELEAAMRTLAAAERYDRHEPGHGQRVARLSAELAWNLGFDASERATVRLASHFHDIGKVSLPAAVVAVDPATLSDEDLAVYRSHIERGEAYLRPLAGDEAAKVVRAHHERWDGTGFPDGLAGESIPVASRLIAVANAFDAWRHPRAADARQPLVACLSLLTEGAGTAFDPAVVEVAVGLFARLAADLDD